MIHLALSPGTRKIDLNGKDYHFVVDSKIAVISTAFSNVV